MINKQELHELLDKTFKAIDMWMEDIPLIKEAKWDLKTCIHIGIQKEMIKFYDQLKEHVINEFKKEVGEEKNDTKENV